MQTMQVSVDDLASIITDIYEADCQVARTPVSIPKRKS
jgi:hypothetical protein